MTERERLIELLNEATDKNGIYLDKIADYLLANGVIVPDEPCRVGDTVYFYNAELVEICKAVVSDYYTPPSQTLIEIEYVSKFTGKQRVEMPADIFKMVCIPVKEAAEEALKEREGE